MNNNLSQELKYELIPQACMDFYAALHSAGFPITNLMGEIYSDTNLSDSFDYVVSHLETKEQREKFLPKKEQMLSRLKKEFVEGTFRITRDDVREMNVKYGPKPRVVQAPRVYYRVGCHAIMVVVERYINPTLIDNTAASIKGRGMHWLFHRIEEDYSNEPDMMQFFYKNDVHHFYDFIDQSLMMQVIRRYISDPVLLPMLDSFITVLPQGLSKGLRSSQCFANIFLSPIDHVMCANVPSYKKEVQTADGTMIETRYLYQRYMDDTQMWSSDKKELWRLRNLHHEEMSKIGLSIKPSEAVRPISEGSDYLGFVFYGTHSLLRKRTKQKAARKLAKVKSRKRRQEIIGSFKGMAVHSDSKHLYYKLTKQEMKKFSEMGIAYQPEDGKKRFPGKVVPIRSITNKTIEVHDFETQLETQHGDGRYLVSFRDPLTQTWGKFFTASKEMQNILDQISDVEDGFPFETEIIMEVYDGKTIPKFT